MAALNPDAKPINSIPREIPSGAPAAASAAAAESAKMVRAFKSAFPFPVSPMAVDSPPVPSPAPAKKPPLRGFSATEGLVLMADVCSVTPRLSDSIEDKSKKRRLEERSESERAEKIQVLPAKDSTQSLASMDASAMHQSPSVSDLANLAKDDSASRPKSAFPAALPPRHPFPPNTYASLVTACRSVLSRPMMLPPRHPGPPSAAVAAEATVLAQPKKQGGGCSFQPINSCSGAAAALVRPLPIPLLPLLPRGSGFVLAESIRYPLPWQPLDAPPFIPINSNAALAQVLAHPHPSERLGVCLFSPFGSGFSSAAAARPLSSNEGRGRPFHPVGTGSVAAASPLPFNPKGLIPPLPIGLSAPHAPLQAAHPLPQAAAKEDRAMDPKLISPAASYRWDSVSCGSSFSKDSLQPAPFTHFNYLDHAASGAFRSVISPPASSFYVAARRTCREEELPNTVFLDFAKDRENALKLIETIRIVSQFPNAKKITVSCEKSIRDNDLIYLVVRLPHLKSLDLSNCYHLTAGALKSLAKLHELEDLNLDRCSHFDSACMKILAKMPHLETLNLDFLQLIKNEDLRYLSALRSLRSLTISNCIYLNDGCFMHLANLRELRELNVSYLDVTSAGIRQLLNLRNLNTLQLVLCDKITDETIQLLMQFPNLQYINLSRCKQITSRTLEILSKFPELRILNLSFNSFSAESTKFFALYPKLERLNLTGCGLTDDDLAELSKVHTLRLLILRRNIYLSDKGLAELGKLPHLQKIVMPAFSIGMTPQAAQFLAKARPGLIIQK